jgi:dihydroorotase/N-acyl-D-amino-acid deacylase
LYDYAVLSGVKPDPENSAKLVLELQLKGGASCIYHAMWEEDVERIMKHPYTMIASDGGESVPHPRSYGTFPRVLGHYVREKNILSLEEAIRKMTSLPAKRLGLTDRGLIKEGNYADITIFDPNGIIDRSTFGQWRNYPDGIDYVIVNGVVTFENGEMTKNRAGKVLRGPAFH